jgi:uncharacterized membrane protein YdfJ with MMPL/SSD domain
MRSFFAATGRFAVRFRWLIVVAWVAAAILAHSFFPSLDSVAKNTNASFLPASSPSVQAARLAGSFQGINQTPVPVVIARGSGTLSATDLSAVSRLAAGLAKVADVQQVKNLGVSRDGRAAQLLVLASINTDAPGTIDQLAAGLRHVIRSGTRSGALPPGLQAWCMTNEAGATA